MKKLFFIILSTMSIAASAQQVLSPELLWKLGRVTPLGISKDGKLVVYKVSINKTISKFLTWIIFFKSVKVTLYTKKEKTKTN